MPFEELRLVIVLTIICVVAGGILAWVNSVTEPRIQAQAELAKKKALQESLPAASEFRSEQLLLEQVHQAGNTNLSELFIGYHETEKRGLVFIADVRGYSSTIRLVIGVSADGQLAGVKVISQAETPGLGVKITERDFLEQPALQRVSSADQLAVVKDGGNVQAVTGATISSRAVVRGVNQALAAAHLLLEAKEQ